MHRIIWLITGLLVPCMGMTVPESHSLIDKDYIKNYLTKDAAWADSHGADGDYLGTAMLYYALCYIQKAKLCVCLGSGGGFVPRVMRQAQRDLGIEGSKTILIDGNIGNWGTPCWLEPDSFFKKHFPEIEIIVDTTHNVAMNQAQNWRINYLHIDADHSLQGALQDFIDYAPFMASNGIITFHDTEGWLPCTKVLAIVESLGYKVVNFNTLGAGVAIIYLGSSTKF